MMQTETPVLNITERDCRAWAMRNMKLGAAVLVAETIAKAERERVDGYCRPIFETFGMKDENGEALPYKHAWRCRDEELFQRYVEACQVAHKANGWKGDPDCCPALVAESRLVDAQILLLNTFCWDLLRLPKTMKGGLHGDLREDALRLAIQGCIKEGADREARRMLKAAMKGAGK